MLTVAAVVLLLASCGDDDADETDDVAAPPTASSAGPATTLGPAPVTAGGVPATTANPAAPDDADPDREEGGDDGGDGDGASFCAANEEFSALLADFFTSADPEAAWRDVRGQLDEVLDALPAEVSSGADAGRAYYDALEAHFEQHDWDIDEALNAPPEVPPEVLEYEDQVTEYTRANCS